MKKLTRIVSLFLALVMFFSMVASVPLTVEAATYSKISNLQVPRFIQYYNSSTKQGDGTCVLASMASIYCYGQGNSYNGKTYYYGKDYNHDDPVYKLIKSNNKNLIKIQNWADMCKKCDFTQVDGCNYNTIYNKLKEGKPVLIYTTSHTSVVIGYNGATSGSSPDISKFIVMDVSQGYSQKDNKCYKTLSSWLGGRTIQKIIYPKSVKSITTNVTVKFNGNGGTVSASSLSITNGSTMGHKIPTATRYGYLFDGWYTAASGGTRYTNSTKINANTNLYAHWSSINDYTGGLKLGAVYRIICKKSGMALQANGTGDGALVTQQPISNSKSQLWTVGYGGGVHFYNLNGGRLLDVKGGDDNMANQAPLQLYGSDEGSHNNRTFIPVSRGSGYYSIHAVHSNRVLDISNGSTSSGAQCQQYYYTGVDQQLFYFEEVGERTVRFYDNLNNNYLPSPREVYNYSGSSTPKECYVSRNTEYITTSVNAAQNKLIITSKKAGSSGNDLTFRTTLNGSYNYEMYDSNRNTMYLGFTAKSSVQGAKMYFRWGYDSEYKSITLNTTETNYLIELPRTNNSGDCIHPYIDRACTVEMRNIQLKDTSNGSIDFNNGDMFNGQIKNYDIRYDEHYNSLPTPKKNKEGCVFDGWYTSRVGGNRIYDYSRISKNTNLYAHWKEVSLSAPTANLTVNANGSFTISWNAVAGADKYEIYMDNGSGYKLFKTLTDTSYTTGVASYGKKYVYKVRAINSKNSALTSLFSKAVSGINTKKLQAPTAKLAMNANGSFTISWNKAAGADKYEIYMDNGSGYKLFKTVTGTSYTTGTATYGKKYVYKVRAVNSKNSALTSLFSKAVSGINTKKLQAPTAKLAVNANGSFTISWNKAAGADKYEIYMDNGSGYKLFKTVTDTSYTTGVASYGKKYVYKVRAVNSKNSALTSLFSKAVSGINTKKLQAPTAKLAVNTNGSFTISWNAVAGADKYEIYMDNGSGYKLFKTLTDTSYTTGVASYGKKYVYKVRAVNSKNSALTSLFSKAVSGINTKK